MRCGMFNFVRMEDMRKRPDASRGTVADRFLPAEDRAAWVSLLLLPLLAWAVLSNPLARYAGPSLTPPALPGLLTPILLIAMLALFFRTARRMADPPAPLPQPSGIVTAGVLVLLLAVGAWMRLSHFDEPLGPFWGDNGMEIIDALNMHDLGHYQVLLSPGAREPGFAFLAQPFFVLFPDMPLYQVQRLASAAIDLAAIAAFYLLGCAVGGRRTGLLAAGLAAVSRTLVMKVLLGLRMVTLPLATALALWAFFRVLERPTRARFTVWAVVLAAGAYTFTSFRALMPFLILSLLLWILQDRGERAAAVRHAFWVPVQAAAVLTVFLWSSGLFGEQSRVWDLARPLPLAALAGLYGAFVLHLAKTGGWVTRRRLMREWLLAVPLLLLLAAPILSQGWIINHASGQHMGIKTRTGNLSPEAAMLHLEAVARSAKTLILGGADTTDYSVSGDAFVDAATAVMLALGACFLASRPSRKALFLLACVPVGAAAHFLSFEHHSGKLLAAFPPLAVLAAWGAARWWDAFRARVRGPLGEILPALLLALLLAWGAVTSHRRAYAEWSLDESHWMVDTRLARLSWKEAGTAQVFITDFARYHASSTAQDALSDGRGIRLLREANRIVLRPGVAPRDVVVLYMEKDREITDRIRREFPRAEWSEVFRGEVKTAVEERPLAPFFIGRVRIAARDLSGSSGRLFETVRAPEDGWVLRRYDGRSGIGRGILRGEEWVPSLATPFPQVPDPVSLGCERTILVERGGRVEFRSAPSSGRVLLRVDGKRVFRAAAGKRGRGSLDLEPGLHRLEILSNAPGGVMPPPCSYREKGRPLRPLF